MRKFEQQERALQRKTYLGNSRYGAAEKDRRKRRIPQAHPFQIDSRKNRAERTGGNEKTGQYELFELIRVRFPRHSPCSESPEQDICNRNGAEELPPAIRECVRNDRVTAFALPERLAKVLIFRACAGKIFHGTKAPDPIADTYLKPKFNKILTWRQPPWRDMNGKFGCSAGGLRNEDPQNRWGRRAFASTAGNHCKFVTISRYTSSLDNAPSTCNTLASASMARIIGIVSE